MSCRTSGDRTAKQRYLIGQKCIVDVPIKDPVDDFKSVQECIKQEPFYEIITAGPELRLSETQIGSNVKAIDVRITPVGTAGTYTTPAKITVNEIGQVLSIIPAPPQGPFTLIAVDGFGDIDIPTPYSVFSIGGDKRSWSGRWTTKESFEGPIKLSFRMDLNARPISIADTPVNPVARSISNATASVNASMSMSASFVGLTQFRSVRDKTFLPLFESGFYFESRDSFGVLDASIRPPTLKKMGTWNSSDIFTVVFTGKECIYYQNGKKLLDVASAIRVPLYPAGAFYSINNAVQSVSSISIDNLVALPYPFTNVQTIMKTTTGGAIKLKDRLIVLAKLLLTTTVDGNISVWGYVDADVPLTLGISIKSVPTERGRRRGRSCDSSSSSSSSSSDSSDSDHKKKHHRRSSSSDSDHDKEHPHRISLTCDKQGTIFYGTPHHIPPKTYLITLTAKAACAASVTESRLMALGNVA